MNISSTSGYSYGSSTSKGLSGLASGMDTEQMVEEMLAGTQGKIDAQEALKKQTEWKQEIYRDLIQQINSLQSKFFSPTSGSSLSNTAFFNAMSAASKSSALKAIATSNAVKGNTSIEVHQLAKNHSMTSSSAVSGKLTGKIDANALQKLFDKQLTGDRKLVIEVQSKEGGSSTVTVDLKEHFVRDGKFVEDIDADAIAASIQSALKSQGGLEAKVSMQDGQLSILSTDMDRWFHVTDESSELALGSLGLEAGDQSKTDSTNSQRTMGGELSLAPVFSFTMTLDDNLKKTIEVDLRDLVGTDKTKIDTSKLQQALQQSIDRQHGKGVVQVSLSGGTLEFRSETAGRKVMIGGELDMLEAIGMKNGQSNRIGLGGKLQDLFFQQALQGDRFRFEINGTKFSFSATDTISDVIKKVNGSSAGVTINYKPLDDKFVMEVNDAGAGRSIEMRQSEGNLLSAMFGSGDGTMGTGSKVVSSQIGTGTLNGGTEYLSDVTKGKFAITVDGKRYTLQIDEKSDKSAYSKTELLRELNKQLGEEVGEFTDASGNVKNRVEINSNGTISARDHAIVTIAGSGTTDAKELERMAEAGDLAVALGFHAEKETSNLATGDTTLAGAGLAKLANALGISTTTKLSDLERATAGMDVSFSFADGRIAASSETTQTFTFGTDGEMEQLFGVDSLTLGDASLGEKASIIQGQNAIVRIDGMFTERSSNIFSYNGVNIELSGISEADGTAAMTGTVYQRAADGTLDPLTLPAGSWLDGGGYLRSADGKFLMADQITVTKDREQALQYKDFVIKDALGNELNGAGISADGTLLDSSGKALMTRKTETVTVTRNTDQIVDGVKGFIEEYNKLFKKINEYLDEDANYRDYPPLTEKQRKEMSEKQIELWEEKAKVGLLRRDSTLEGMLQSMRSIWYETNGSGYAIYQLGIETGEWDKKGQLVMSPDGEATLRRAIESDPGGVTSFFTNENDGAAARVNQVITKMANVSSGSPGTLVQLAGIKGMSSEKNNTLYNRIQDIDDKIDSLKHIYKKEKERYWNQFNAMEQMISQMNSQSSWLAQQFA